MQSNALPLSYGPILHDFNFSDPFYRVLVQKCKKYLSKIKGPNQVQTGDRSNSLPLSHDFSDSRTNLFEEGDDDKNHGVPIGSTKLDSTSIHTSSTKLDRLGSTIISCVIS